MPGRDVEFDALPIVTDKRCRGCAACCLGLPDMYANVSESDRAREPRLAGKQQLAVGERCEFLAGKLCSIYATRPDVCRNFEIAGYQCRTTRAAAGLPPPESK